MKKERIDQEQLKELLLYDEATGIFKWRVKNNRTPIGSTAGTKKTNGYIGILIRPYLYYAHRLAFLYMTGDIPPTVDHINGVRNDNRWCNLRGATRSQNGMNAKLSKRNKSGFKGVIWNKSANKWQSYITKDGILIHIGYFDDKKSAILASSQERLRIHKEFSNHG